MRFSSCCFGLALLCGMGGSSSAGPRIVIPDDWLPWVDCPTASLGYCQDPQSAQNATCWGSNRDACKPLLADAFRAYHAGLVAGGPVQAVMPEGISGAGRLFGGVGRQAYDRSRAWALFFDHTYASVSASAQLSAPFATPGDTSPIHPDWEGNGATVASCAEFTHEKYYGYSRFEDAAASCGLDYFCVYDLAQRPGFGGLAHAPLEKKNGAPMEVQLRPVGLLFPQTRPKNTFFRLDIAAVLAKVLSKYAPAEAPAIVAAAQQVRPYRILDRFDWHVRMHDAQTPEHLTLAEHADQARRLAGYSALVDDFLDYKGQLEQVGPAGRKTVRDILDPNPLCTLSGCGPEPRNSYPTDSLAGKLLLTVNNLRQALVEEWTHKSAKDGTTVDHGCLDPRSNRCDWSPRLFVDEYAHRFAAERERDFQRCNTVTGGTFDESNYPPMHLYNRADTDLLDRWMDYAESVRAEALKGLPKTKDGTGRDAIGSRFPGGGVLGDSDWFAVIYRYDVGYDVELDGPVEGSVKKVCKAKGRVFADLSAEVDVARALMGDRLSKKILDAQLEAYAGANGNPTAYARYDVLILDESWYHERGTERADQFHLAPSDARLRGGPSYDAYFAIGPVPVHMNVGLSFGVELASSASGIAPQSCDEAHPALMSLGVRFGPRASAQAHLSAAVGAEFAGFGAETGVAGDLRLLEVGLPVSVTAGLSVDGDRQSWLTLASDGRFQLSALSGSVSAYADMCFGWPLCYRVEKQIFSWPGVALASPELFHLEKSFPLVALRSLFPPQGGP